MMIQGMFNNYDIAEFPVLYRIEKSVCFEMQVKTTLKKHFWAHLNQFMCSLYQANQQTNHAH